MWKSSATVTLLSLLWATVQAGQNSVYSQNSFTPSNQVSSYHYPAPPHSQQLIEVSVRPITSSQVGYVPQHSANGAAQTYQNQYQGNYYTRSNSQKSVITKQFASPALENAAFNFALTNQGYTFGNTPAVNAALATSSRSSKTASQTVAASSPPSSPSATSSPSSQLTLTSLNVKLPLPIGVTPLNIGPLPLQGGAPYNSIPNAVTSYGTPYPQRKRR